MEVRLLLVLALFLFSILSVNSQTTRFVFGNNSGSEPDFLILGYPDVSELVDGRLDMQLMVSEDLSTWTNVRVVGFYLNSSNEVEGRFYLTRFCMNPATEELFDLETYGTNWLFPFPDKVEHASREVLIAVNNPQLEGSFVSLTYPPRKKKLYFRLVQIENIPLGCGNAN